MTNQKISLNVAGPEMRVSAGLPAGYTARPVTMQDLVPAVDLFNAFTRSQLGVDQATVDGIRSEWNLPEMDIAKNTMAVFAPDGQIVGYMEFHDIGEVHMRLFGWAAIDPRFWGRGISRFLMAWLEERARQALPLAPADARVVIQIMAQSHNQQAADLFATLGFEPVRNFYTMRINFTTPPAPAEIPQGIVLRSVKDEAEERAALRAAHEAFVDHWGHTDETFEHFYGRVKYFMSENPFYEPGLFFIAMDGEAIAGVSLCYSGMDEDPDLAWVGTLGVRRAWRKRGVGLALLQHSFDAFYQRGKPRAGLSVDASSLTGATRLYTRAGMHVHNQNTCYELELRPGKDYTTRSLSSE